MPRSTSIITTIAILIGIFAGVLASASPASAQTTGIDRLRNSVISIFGFEAHVDDNLVMHGVADADTRSCIVANGATDIGEITWAEFAQLSFGAPAICTPPPTGPSLPDTATLKAGIVVSGDETYMISNEWWNGDAGRVFRHRVPSTDVRNCLTAGGGRAVIDVQPGTVGHTELMAIQEGPEATCGVTGWTAGADALEAEFIRQINIIRSQPRTCMRGDVAEQMPAVPPVTGDARLSQAADAHSVDMMTNHMFGHAGSDGSSFSQRAERFGTTANGENVAANNGPASVQNAAEVTRAIDQWLASSSGHCQGVMSANATRMGIGYANNGLALGHTQMAINYWTMKTGA